MIDLQAIKYNDVFAAAEMDDLDAACGHLQTIAGITDGGVAGLHFSGGEDKPWTSKDKGERVSALMGWLETEQQFQDEDEKRAQAADAAAFAEWQLTRRPCDDLGAEYGDDSLTGRPGWVYSSGYIEKTSGRHEVTGAPIAKYYLLIERDDWLSDDYAELERILWDRFARDEITNG